MAMMPTLARAKTSLGLREGENETAETTETAMEEALDLCIKVSLCLER
eukprot:CAMPEP_0171592600 /NCGR_PEP_ID=MMETSP0961-20121227/16954_1 /TAXON_ID=87120 /ORGANISM="Aurantiochytrium limacinum, Strain ATCCMYA-1381" /LENGTH=47 /DNA_ID= /DNA_START= /DNA_END= /DNA_ORIENTATION=